MKNKQPWLPSYTYLPLVLVFVVNTLAYFPTKLLTEDTVQHDLSIALDNQLPFVPFFVLFYVLAYAQWVWSYCYHCRQDRQTCYYIVTGDLVAKVICVFFFVFLPTEIARPEITGNSLWEQMVGLIYTLDTPHNLFPSVHCLESWMCVRGALMMKDKRPWYIAAQAVLSVLVFASTVLIKQHFLVDIAAGILVCELGLLIARKTKLWRWFTKKDTVYDDGELNL